MVGRPALLIATGVVCIALVGCQTLPTREAREGRRPGFARVHTFTNSVPECPYVMVGEVDGPQWHRQARALGAHAVLGRPDNTSPRAGLTGTAIRFSDASCRR
jgi:hypothetical protein